MSDIRSEKLAEEAAEKAWFEFFQYKKHSWMWTIDTEAAMSLAKRAANIAIERAVAARELKVETLRDFTLSACRDELTRLVKQIGTWDKSIPDSGMQELRGETWHKERASWISEFKRLRDALAAAQVDTKRLIMVAQKVKPIVGAAVASASNEIRPLREKAYNELCEAISAAMNQPK